MNKDQAVAVAQEALIWLLNRPEELEHFLKATGTPVTDLRPRSGDPEFLGFLLEFLSGSDETIVALAADTGKDPHSFLAARAELPGGAVPNWT